MNSSAQTVERVVRDSYGRLLAFLAARSRDVASAEDALADSFAKALELWPENGVPQNPEAWLLVAARRKLADRARHARVRQDAEPAISEALEEAGRVVEQRRGLPDERLQMLFLCSHPAIDESVRTPLMLQVVLGIDASRIASSFLLGVSAMSQRLVRAKAKIKDARIRFDLPEPRELKGRLPFVLDAIYAAYTIGWSQLGDADLSRREVASEALYLGQLLVDFLPDQPEALGLLALMLYCESRNGARRSESAYLPLKQQDTNRWSKPMIAEAEQQLTRASAYGATGRFQLEAAIQSAHIHQALTGASNQKSIALMYEALLQVSSTVGVMVNHAAAVAESEGALAGIMLLNRIPGNAIETYQPFWALSGHLHSCLQQPAEAIVAYRRAILFCENEPVRAFLASKVSELTTQENRICRS
jgi:RNA polymerase sigma-70 factor (ECF subfamily)